MTSQKAAFSFLATRRDDQMAGHVGPDRSTNKNVEPLQIRRVLDTLRHRAASGTLIVLVFVSVLAFTANAEVLYLKSGMRLDGTFNRISELGENPLAVGATAGGVNTKLIIMADDQLRRSFVSWYQRDSLGDDLEQFSPIRLRHNLIARNGPRLGSIGGMTVLEPFDEYGRRTVRLITPKEELEVVQGITEIHPLYVKVEGMLTERGLVWDMRIGTLALSSEVLLPVLRRTLEIESPQHPDNRLTIIRFLLNVQRYQDATSELESAIRDFPDLEDRLAPLRKQLLQLQARRLLEEFDLRSAAGQHRYVRSLLNRFPTDDIAAAIVAEIARKLRESQTIDRRVERVKELVTKHLAELPDEALRMKCIPIIDQIITDVNANNLARFAAYLRLADDESLPVDQKLSIGISGWLLGSDASQENLAVAASLGKVRDLVRDYLATPSGASDTRAAIIAQFGSLEGATPESLTKLLAMMKPPRQPELNGTPNGSGSPHGNMQPPTQRFEIPGAGSDDLIEYFVQLPPEYDPYRRYPTIVTLHGAGITPAQQIDWWAGPVNANLKQRRGQATRYGYIVVAPQWAAKEQGRYEYSAQEHAAVLWSLRDALTRFSIDSDRVFLSGHAMGGVAAWDIALAHPDLWAGVIPISAVAHYGNDSSPRYVSRYWKNAQDLPLYFTNGEKDGNNLLRNGEEFDRYLRTSKFDAMVVQYIGRGNGHFQEEIQRMFEWMELDSHRRRFDRAKFYCESHRPWDRFFWWLEASTIPPRSVILPRSWPAPRGTRPAVLSGEIRRNQVNLSTVINVRASTKQFTVWLSPELVDFSRPISLAGRRKSIVKPSVETLLEDVRSRGDRQHVFWAKIEGTGRG